MAMKRYRHDLSNTRLTSFDMGKIIVTRAEPVLAGTSVIGGIAAGLQLAPMEHQSLTQIRVDTFAIACPDRLIWDDAEDFYTGGATGDVRPEVPYVVAPDGGWEPGSTMDHIGAPTGVPGLKFDARPLRALIKWYNENCLDLTIQTPLPLSTASGLDTTTYTGDLRINWPKDRFTTARKEKQLGDEVVIPIVGHAPVEFVGSDVTSESDVAMRMKAAGTGALSAGAHNIVNNVTAGNTYGWVQEGAGTNVANAGLFISNAQANIAQAAGVLPGEFNFAMGRARWKMRRNLFGTEFRDLLAFWGIRYSDRRLQYAQTLAHGRQLIDISAVLQTAPGTNSAVGQVAGRGTGFGVCSYKQYFEEWTQVLHLIVVRPAPVYVNMYPEKYDIEVREDTYTPEFAHADLVPIKRKILFPTGTDTDNETWGYANPYDYKRSSFNDVTGRMKTTEVSYHQGRIFETSPELNSDFLQCNPSGRIFSITDETITDHIEAAAIRNKFIEKSFVTPNGNPKFIGG